MPGAVAVAFPVDATGIEGGLTLLPLLTVAPGVIVCAVVLLAGALFNGAPTAISQR